MTDGQQGDLGAVTLTGSTSAVSLVWQSICHAANYIIYRSGGAVHELDRDRHLLHAEVGDASRLGRQLRRHQPGAEPDRMRRPRRQPHLLRRRTRAHVHRYRGDHRDGHRARATFPNITYTDTPMPAGWTPPVVENANELPWEQNPYFIPALEAVGIKAVGADGSKPYPNPPDDQFGLGNTYSGATYPAGQSFVDGTAQVAPRHPINIFYNAATNAQELDEYNTLYDANAPGSQCHTTGVTTCATTPFTFTQVVEQVVSGMLQNMLSNDPNVSYVHQTNLLGKPPYSSVLPPANYVPSATAQTGTDGDGLLYEVLNPLINEYDSYYNSTTAPYQQLTLGGIGNILANQTAWAPNVTGTGSDISATETNGVVTITNSGAGSLEVPVSVPSGTTSGGATFGQAYGGQLSDWANLASGASLTLNESVSPAITSAADATSNVGAPFSFTVTTTGVPAPTLTMTAGTLPSGLTLVDNGNGTATISGTPATGTGGTYPITITATNSAGTATQDFTLTNSQAPTITSPTTATFTTTVPGSYAITTTGFPAPTLTDNASTLPSGLTFVDNGNGTGAISGTPAAGTQGTYPVTISATNTKDDSTATLGVTLTVNPAVAPTISAGTADFTLGQMGAIAVTATGNPTPSITESGAIPPGLTFVDNGNGTALLSGMPTATGTFPVTVDASNGINPDATQSLSIVVGQAGAFTSAGTVSATAGQAFSFNVTTSGYPAPSLAQSGLPADLKFVDNGDGTGTISGTPSAGDVGSHDIKLSSANFVGTTGQDLTLNIAEAQPSTPPVVIITTPPPTPTPTPTTTPTTVATSAPSAKPAFTSAASVAGSVGQKFSFQVTTTGSPVPNLLDTPLPSGLSWTGHGDGTATISGMPKSTAVGVTKVVLTASSLAGSTQQVLSITIQGSPGITTGNLPVATVGRHYSFTVVASGYPFPSMTESGALPAGLVFTPQGKGRAVLSGVPTKSSGGVRHISVTVTNAMGKAVGHYTLTVGAAPAITASSSAKAHHGAGFSFTVKTNGYPQPTFSHTGLPAGLKWASTGNGTATISGRPTAAAIGAHKVTITAMNAYGKASVIVQITVS